MALKGMGIITFNANNENEKVSHIKTSYLDQLLAGLTFKPLVELDNELGVYTVSLNELYLYGEGNTPEEAAEDLVSSIILFLAIYTDKIDLFSKAESETKQLYLLNIYLGIGRDGLWRTCKFDYHKDKVPVATGTAKTNATSVKFKDVRDMKGYMEKNL